MTRSGYLLIATIIVGVFVGMAISQAEDLSNDPRHEVQELKDQLSVDMTPVEFTFLGVKYRVPRNYIVHMGGPMTPPTFRVTFPGFEPLTEKTRQCLTQPRAYWPSGCVPIEFWLGGLSPLADGTILSDDDHFNNVRKWFHGRPPRQSPNGLEVYENGVGEDNELQIYRKKTSTHTLLITCNYYAADGKRGAVCTNYNSPLPNGNSLSYRIDLDQTENAEKIDDGIRALIDSFTLKGDKP